MTKEKLKVCVLGTESRSKQSVMMQALKRVTDLVAQTVETVAEADLVIAFSFKQFKNIKDKQCAIPSFDLLNYFYFISKVAKIKKKIVVYIPSYDKE